MTSLCENEVVSDKKPHTAAPQALLMLSQPGGKHISHWGDTSRLPNGIGVYSNNREMMSQPKDIYGLIDVAPPTVCKEYPQCCILNYWPIYVYMPDAWVISGLDHVLWLNWHQAIMS